MWKVQILVGLLRCVRTLITINIATGVFAAFPGICCSLQCMPRLTVVVFACVESFMPLLAVSSRFCLPLLSMRGRASVVIVNAKVRIKSVFFLLDGLLPKKRNKATCMVLYVTTYIYH